MNQQEMLEILRSVGLNVLPLKPRSKDPVIRWKEYQTTKYTETFPLEFNIGVICGETSGNLEVIDIDFPDKSVIEKILPNALSETLVVKTGKGGYHIYLRTNKMTKTMRLESSLGRIDVQSQGSYVVGPFSDHPNGNQYEIISSVQKIATVDFDIIMKNLEDLGFESTKSTALIEVEKHGAKEGSRNDSMFKLACKYLRELDESTAFALLQAINEKNNPPLGQKELETLFESAKKYTDNPEESDPSKTLYDFAISKIKKLVVSQNNSREVYAVVEINEHNETLDLSSSRAIFWLNCISQTNRNFKIRGEEFFRNVLNAIISRAQINNTSREKVYNRIAFVGNTLYYDLTTNDWSIIKIDREGIKIVPYTESTPVFRRSQNNFEQHMPAFDDVDALDKFMTLLRIKDRQTFKVHFVSMFLEHIAVPIMQFDGAAGSMKSTITAAIKATIDPNGIGTEDNCTSIPSQNDDLKIQLYNRYVSAFDNVTKITQETSDTLCRAITGGSNPRRALYTNADEMILSFRRKIVLNGIVLNFDFTDLQDRTIVYERIPLGEQERLTEQEFQERLQKLLPSILGQVFTMVHKATGLYDTVIKQVRPNTRLADFEIWGETISQAMGYKQNSFLEEYYNKQRRTVISIKDQHPIILALEALMENKHEYENSISKCFSDLKQRAMDLEIDVKSQFVKFPRASNKLWDEITRVKPLLTKMGMEAYVEPYTKNDSKYTKNSKVITIRKQSNDQKTPSPSSLSSLLETYTQDQAKGGEDIDEANKTKITEAHQLSQ